MDATVSAEKQVVGLGVVVRDVDRNCLAAIVKTTKYFGNVAMAKAVAVEWVLQVALKVGGTSMVLESDSQEVVSLVNNRKNSMYEIFWVISKILENKKNFYNFKAQHTPRLYNGIAHSIAKFALQMMEIVIQLDEVPIDICICFQIYLLKGMLSVRDEKKLWNRLPNLINKSRLLESLNSFYIHIYNCL